MFGSLIPLTFAIPSYFKATERLLYDFAPLKMAPTVKNAMSPSKKIACKHPGCKKVYVNRSGLSRHKKSHESIKTSYLCPLCNNRLIRRIRLRDHIMNQHAIDRERATKLAAKVEKTPNSVKDGLFKPTDNPTSLPMDHLWERTFNKQKVDTQSTSKCFYECICKAR